MKRFLPLLCLSIICIPSITFGNLFSGPSELDLYHQIDKGYKDLELKFVEKELKGGDMQASIADNLNNIAKQQEYRDCFSGDIQASDIAKIASDDEAIPTLQLLIQECFNQETSIASNELTQYYDLVNQAYSESVIRAKAKIDNIYQISKIGMYSDGIAENSPFDLMIDIQDINDIVFETFIPYDGVNTIDIGKSVDFLLDGLPSSIAYSNSTYAPYIDDVPYSNTGGGLIENDMIGDICLDNNSGLSDEMFAQLISQTYQLPSQNGAAPDPQDDDVWSPDTNRYTQSSYEIRYDNSIWPCDNFFCILIDFSIYDHKLLGGSTNLSIEGLLKRSNEHLKKFASTSLIQSKMTTNNFELGLKDLNLPDLFHVGVIVSHKPVPMLNIQKNQDQKDQRDFEVENLLSLYYKNLGLDYNRANDISLLNTTHAELKSVLDAIGRSSVDAADRYEGYKNLTNELKQQNHYISRYIIDPKIISDDMEGFYYRYIELASFVGAMHQYSQDVNNIIIQMNKIPQGG